MPKAKRPPPVSTLYPYADILWSCKHRHWNVELDWFDNVFGLSVYKGDDLLVRRLSTEKPPSVFRTLAVAIRHDLKAQGFL